MWVNNSQYFSFNKWNLEYRMKWILLSNKVGFMKDITNELIKSGIAQEMVYEVTTQSPLISILIFTSINLLTCRSDNKGMNTIRMIMKWRHPKFGNIYKGIGKIYVRDERIYNDIKKVLVDNKEAIYDLHPRDFSVDICYWI